MVERFKVDEMPRSSASKTLAIEKGRGTQLKDIPNVLSKRRADENLQPVGSSHHSLWKESKGLLYVHTLKKNLGLFSGFIWAENEEKQKLKVKEKIDKCVKEKLLDFCDVLNISLNKSIYKEELVAKLLEFLESPHATTDALHADKENVKKRKSKGSASKSPAVVKFTKMDATMSIVSSSISSPADEPQTSSQLGTLSWLMLPPKAGDTMLCKFYNLADDMVESFGVELQDSDDAILVESLHGFNTSIYTMKSCATMLGENLSLTFPLDQDGKIFENILNRKIPWPRVPD
ncbi:hypothetical protein CASFOL_000825 [Castilleja foliolosa]|uniref:Uncharacterized protein n=1 Tax=Castilleja foliolosa TaxID=1961234 RepID=A0ABD3EPL8_9LAMI